MSDKFDQPLTIRLDTRPSLAGFIWLSHLLAVAVLFLPLSVPPAFRWLAGLLVLASLAFNLCRHRYPGRQGVKAFGWDRQNGWFIRFVDESKCSAALLADSYISTPLVIVRLKCDSGRVHEFVIPAFPGSRQSMRQLRLRMRQEPLAAVTPADSDPG